MPHLDALRRNSVLLLAKWPGIERVLDTCAGSDTLRGISGGERKRVTIAEMAMSMISGGVFIMDN